MLAPLGDVEIRVLGALLEKARTTPDSYPLSLNALTSACNQASNREPVMSLSEIEVSAAVDALRKRSLVRAIVRSGGAITRYQHVMDAALGLVNRQLALLCVLMLRGPQTAGELRINSERWYRFADISSVEAFLEELRDRSEEKGGPLVVLLPRAPGMREQRWAHLLCGPVSMEQAAAAAANDMPRDALESRVAALENEVAALRSALQDVREQLGLSQPGQAA
jgi:uncharacterized protein YceH (UPF0502 family)